jgi:hypothetical protein
LKVEQACPEFDRRVGVSPKRVGFHIHLPFLKCLD